MKDDQTREGEVGRMKDGQESEMMGGREMGRGGRRDGKGINGGQGWERERRDGNERENIETEENG